MAFPCNIQSKDGKGRAIAGKDLLLMPLLSLHIKIQLPSSQDFQVHKEKLSHLSPMLQEEGEKRA